MPVNEEMRSHGTFVPASESECNVKTWYTSAVDLSGRPLLNVQQRYTTWMQGGNLQKFHAALEVESEFEGKFQAPEVDCNHHMCHVHPNGHHPPSGKQVPLIKVMDLFTSADVRSARGIGSCILEMTIIKLLINGGVWNERAVSAEATRSAHEAANRISKLQN